MDKSKLSPGDLLLPQNMIRLYAHGVFPMSDAEGNVNWYYPQTRAVIPLDKFNMPRTLKQFMKTCNFTYKFDYNILGVVKRCASRKRTWISQSLIEAYTGLIKIGHVHSVEVYVDKKMLGGLYGVTYKGAFFGESMFSKVSQASKTALVKLVEHLQEKNFTLLDIQFMTPHLKMFGAKEISLEEFNRLLISAYSREVKF